MEDNEHYNEALKIAGGKNPDFTKAAGLLEKAVESGSSDALFAIGNWYFYGRHYSKNIGLAIDYWERAASNSNIDAIHELAKIYECGVYQEKDLSRSFYYYTMLALMNDGQGCYEVGRYFEHGIYVPENKVAATLWRNKAEELGYTESEDTDEEYE